MRADLLPAFFSLLLTSSTLRASALPSSTFVRRCSPDEWCIPSWDPWDAILGGAAAVGEVINMFQLPTLTDDKKSDDPQHLTPPDLELDVTVVGTDEDQCQKAPSSQPGQVSFFPQPFIVC